jgi:hypothetical protein
MAGCGSYGRLIWECEIPELKADLRGPLVLVTCLDRDLAIVTQKTKIEIICDQQIRLGEYKIFFSFSSVPVTIPPHPIVTHAVGRTNYVNSPASINY